MNRRFNTYHYPVIYASIFLIIVSIPAPFIIVKLNDHWVKAVLSLFHPKLWFDIIFIIFVGGLGYWHRNQRLRTFDFVVIGLYLYGRMLSNIWNLWPVTNWPFLSCVKYIDTFALYYSCIIFFGTIRLFKSEPVIDTTYDYLEADIPITRAQQDKLGRFLIGQNIADIIEKVNPGGQSFAIGICGPWGSAETSLLALTREKLEKREKETNSSLSNFRRGFLKMQTHS